MSILDKHLGFVNDQLTFHNRKAEEYSILKNHFRHKKHLDTATKFQALYDDLIEASKALDKPQEYDLKKPKQLRLILNPKEIQDLPDELVAELSEQSTDKGEFTILNLMEEAGGIMSLDQIIVGLYRQTGEVNKRQNVTSRLYRMAQRGLIYNAPKKGVYSLTPITDEEFNKLLDGDSSE
jgi:hypothetical protein